jgi:hypothetical protein
MATRRQRRFDLIVAVSVLVVALGWGAWHYGFPGRAFDSAVWKDKTHTDDAIRLEMADRLVAQETLQGKTQQEVVDLLGEPQPQKHGEQDFVYWLGSQKFGADSWWLTIRFRDSRVSECRVVPD